MEWFLVNHSQPSLIFFPFKVMLSLGSEPRDVSLAILAYLRVDSTPLYPVRREDICHRMFYILEPRKKVM